MNILKLVNGTPIQSNIREFRKDVGVMCRNEPPAETLAEKGYHYYLVVNPVYNPDIQTVGDWEFQETIDGWVWTRPVRDMTQQELDERSIQDDEQYIGGSGRLVAILLVQLIKYLLANSIIDPAAFTPKMRQAFQELKARIERRQDD